MFLNCASVVPETLQEDTANYVCYNDGLYPDMEDCVRFYECVSGKSTSLTCPSELVYNERTKTCDVMKNVPECNYVMRDDTINVINQNGAESEFDMRNLDDENDDKFSNVQVINEGKSVVEAISYQAMPIDKTFDFTQQELTFKRPKQKNDIKEHETHYNEKPQELKEQNKEQGAGDYLVFKDVKKELETKREKIDEEKKSETATNNLKIFEMTNHNDGELFGCCFQQNKTEQIFKNINLHHDPSFWGPIYSMKLIPNYIPFN